MQDRVRRPALRGTLLGAVLRLLNPVVRGLLASGFHRPLSRWLILLRWDSAEAGRRRTTPLSYVREGAFLYLTTGDRWSEDLMGGAEVAIRLSGRWYAAEAIVETDPEEAAAILGRLSVSAHGSGSCPGSQPRPVGQTAVQIRMRWIAP